MITVSKYYFNTKKGIVQKGRLSGWMNRLGPYDTYAEAEQALKRVQSRNEEWKDQEEDYKGED